MGFGACGVGGLSLRADRIRVLLILGRFRIHLLNSLSLDILSQRQGLCNHRTQENLRLRGDLRRRDNCVGKSFDKLWVKSLNLFLILPGICLAPFLL